MRRHVRGEKCGACVFVQLPQTHLYTHGDLERKAGDHVVEPTECERSSQVKLDADGQGDDEGEERAQVSQGATQLVAQAGHPGGTQPPASACWRRGCCCCCCC